MRPTVMEVDLSALKNNISEIKKYIGNKELMPIIKANAYGTHVNKIVSIFKEFNIVGVATIKEGINLRKLGFKKEIFILNQPSIDELDEIVKYSLTIGLSSFEFLQEALKRNVKIKVHLELETGMNRTGINLLDIEKFLQNITQNIKVEGIYTHLSSADFDEEYTKEQLNKFEYGVKKIKDKIPSIKYIHSLASSGILNYLSEKTNLVRPGIILYGYYPSEHIEKNLNLKPICKLKTKIVFLKEVSENSSISYSRNYITNQKTKVATIPIGYADGLTRTLSNKGYVVINNKKCKILGNICMDSCMVDVTEINNVKIGEDVYIWDNNIIKLEEIANLCDTINYEIISTISNRVERVFIE